MLCTRSTTPYLSSKASGKVLTTNARTQKGSHVACDVQGSDNTLWGLNKFGGGVSDQYIKSQRKGNHSKPFSYCQLQSTALLTRLLDFSQQTSAMAVHLRHRLGAPLWREFLGLSTPETTTSIQSIIMIIDLVCKRAGEEKSIRLTPFALLRPPPPNKHRCMRDRRLWPPT